MEGQQFKFDVALEFVFAHVAQLVEHPYGRSAVQI